MSEYEVILDGGGPWGIRLQGGKDFGVPLNVARVNPGSKAAMKGMLAGDQIVAINGSATEQLTHLEAQNLIKSAGNRLQLQLKQGKGASLGEIKQVGGGGFQAGPSKTLYATDVTHSAGVDHKYNAKPRAFGAASDTSSTGGGVKKFDPGEYARKKKEELERYKEEQKKPVAPDSDVLKMLQNTHLDQKSPTNTGSFSRLQHQLDNEGNWAEEEKAFRMTADQDLSDVSPGSRAVMDDIRNRGTSGLSHSGTAAGGSKSFKRLQLMTEADDDLPPPPPELIDGGPDPSSPKSGTFKMLQQHIDSGTADQVQTVFSQPPSQRDQAVPAAPKFQPSSNRNTSSTVNAIPKAPMPSGPNFKVGQPKAPTFKSSAQMFNESKAPPPAVNAGKIENPNSRLLQQGYPSSPPSSQYSPRSSGQPNSQFSPRSSTSSVGQGGYGGPPNTPKSPGYGGPPNTPKSPGMGGGHSSPPSGSDKDVLCHACGQPCSGPFVSAIGKTWHPEHFCCSSCNVSLQNQAFVEENNQLFCEKCYNQHYAPKCAHCNKAIIGNCINALGKSWHPDHFVCAFCGRGFGNEGFLVDNGKPYCGKCFEDLFSVKCGKCLKPITGGEKYVEALNKNWHSQCFTCTQCNVRLEGNSFFVARGMPYCPAHKTGN